MMHMFGESLQLKGPVMMVFVKSSLYTLTVFVLLLMLITRFYR
ncbi:hypothetical protein [Magnetococcus sp. PR-3]